MKKLFTLFVAALCALSVWAYDFKVDGICYDIWTEDMAPRSIVTNNEVVVTYSSTTNNYPYLTTTTIPETVTYNGITYTVVGIWNSAFANCSSLKSIVIPNSVDMIGEKAFYNTALTTIHLSKFVRVLYPSAFENCKSLNSVNIECENLISYGSIFSGCTALESVVWNVKKADSSPFWDNTTVKSFTFGESVEIIPSGCCYSMSKLTSITIPTAVTQIGESAFENCTSLSSITIPTAVTQIGESAFENCTSLSSITIGDHVERIGQNAFTGTAFYNNTSNWDGDVLYLTNYLIATKKSILGEYNIKTNTRVIAAGTFSDWSFLKSVNIPNTVVSIGAWSFNNCTSLTSIKFPNSITYIGGLSFKGCTKLKTIEFSEGLVCIDDDWTEGAFQNCSSLTSITFPASLKSIGYRCFDGCTSLESITCLSTIPPIVVFPTMYYNFNWDIPVYVPCGTVDVYANTDWKQFINIQEPTANYTITVSSNIQSCSARVDKNTVCGALVSATPSYGYHFAQWSDGSKDNPYSLLLTKNHSLIAEFAPNQYTIITQPFDQEGGYTQGDTIVDYLEYITISATANYGYHFTSWNDGNTDNPRAIQVTEDNTFTAKFDKNTYDITKKYDSTKGRVSGPSSAKYLDEITVSATANYGYHFTQWSDGNTDNPRMIVVTQDTTLTAEFAPNQYTITTQSTDKESGYTQGDTIVDYLEYITISATANYGYHFTSWNDGNTDNPRAIQVTEDNTFTAKFDKNTYAITSNCNAEMGSITAPDSAEYLDEVTISATANYGYHFTKWSDGNTNNPRTLVVTQDTTLTAEFAPNQYRITTNSADPERGTTQGDTTVNYLDYASISATANYGYYFSKWNDGNTDNLRTIQVTKDIVYTAYFEKKTYAITLSGNSERGTVSGFSSAKYLDEITVSATANYGYHFTQWSDGNTDNPRTIVVTQDTTLTAEFAPNQYTVTTQSTDKESGYTQGDTIVDYLEYIIISATANYGYYFSKWNDGNTDNPRVIQVTNNARYTAYFDKHTYRIRVNYDNNKGSVSGKTSARYLEKVTLSAIPKCGYHFTQWGDGNTDNPRTLVLTQDTIFTAEFAQSYSGQCGDNLYWTYNEDNKKISITGSGKMYDYTKSTQPWLLFQEQITEVTTSNTTSSIGASAFAGCIRLGKVSLGYGMENIAANAFAECKRLYDIYVYATYPPFADESSFANYNVDLYIPCESKRDYEYDIVWGEFKYIECIGAESDETGGDDVTVTPGSNDVTITWPTEDEADTYSIVITKDGEVFCTLTFNSNGQLLNIAFAPGREGNHPAQYAEAVANGYRFTVTGLDESTKYAYNLDVNDSLGKTIKSYEGEFTTQSTTALDNTHSQSPMTNCQKIFRDGQLLIIRDGKTYNAQGVEL